MTDNAEKKLLSLCEVAQQDLELSNLSEEGELLSHWSNFVTYVTYASVTHGTFHLC